ncbi:hypothetical protein [Thermicanus aegyptius]|uniref:hypothetical protein n=1 Tax=Thermicanus aegyptius TaxID=94009 RepID=UPI0003F790D2|nr:hypothetical protein [Thermicanus aegyptius]
MEYSKETIELKVKKAVYKLLKEDLYLLQNDLHERTISHKLAYYLQAEFPNLHVDCEYNKNIDEDNNPKKIRVQKELEAEFNNFKEELGKNFLKSKYQEMINNVLYSVISVYPDIIVHRRNESENNLLIIEVKKKGQNSRNTDYDEKKLICYTDPKNPNKLKYKYGVLIKFNTSEKDLGEVTGRWFEDGQPVSDEIKFNIDHIAH